MADYEKKLVGVFGLNSHLIIADCLVGNMPKIMLMGGSGAINHWQKFQHL